VLATTFGITTLVLIFGESAPKSYAVENTESWALRIARPLKLSEYALYPLVVLRLHRQGYQQDHRWLGRHRVDVRHP